RRGPDVANSHVCEHEMRRRAAASLERRMSLRGETSITYTRALDAPKPTPIAKEVTMAQTVSSPVTRRSVVAGLTLTAAPVAALAGADHAYAQAKPATSEKSLYERLGGVFAIAAVVDHFSDAVVKNPVVGQKSKNPQLREWHTKNLKRLPGLKFMRTLWVCNVSGGPFQFTATRPGKTPVGLAEA